MGIREEITSELNEELRGDLLDAATEINVIRREPDGSGRKSPMAKKGEVWTKHHAFNVISHGWDAKQADGDRIKITDNGYLVFSDNIEIVPDVGDRVEHAGKTYDITHVETDPIGATFDIAARRIQ